MLDYLKQEIFVGEDLYVFEAEDAGEILNWHGEDNSSAGEYITGLIRNRMSGGNITAVTLRELFYEKYKEDKILRLPIVKIRNGSLEVEVINQENIGIIQILKCCLEIPYKIRKYIGK